MTRPRLKNVYFAFLAGLVILLSIEALLRLTETVRADIRSNATLSDHGPWSIYSPEFGWERRPGFHGITDLDGVARAFDSQGYFSVDSQKVADQTKRKVVFIGDSNTFGFGVPPSASFAEVVNDAWPDIATINLGVAGYTSFQGSKTLAKYLPLLRPAAIVVSFNANDRREIYEGDIPDSDERFRRMYRGEESPLNKIRGALEWLRSYRALRSAMMRMGVLPQPGRGFRIDRLRPRVDEVEYRKNLSNIAAQARQSGIPLIFVVPRDNPLQAGYLRKGIEKLDASEFNDAIEYLGRAAQRSNSFNHLARIYLAKAWEAEGDRASASRALFSTGRSESLHGGLPIRLDSAYNEIMRQVARENRVEVVEAAAVLDQDPYVYIDDIHFNAMGHRKVAQLLAARLSELLQKTKYGPGSYARVP